LNKSSLKTYDSITVTLPLTISTFQTSTVPHWLPLGSSSFKSMRDSKWSIRRININLPIFCIGTFNVSRFTSVLRIYLILLKFHRLHSYIPSAEFWNNLLHIPLTPVRTFDRIYISYLNVLFFSFCNHVNMFLQTLLWNCLQRNHYLQNSY